MSDLSRMDPTGRFTGLAELYARCRPDYPTAAIDFILSRCNLGPGSVLIDVGCGTGISTRLFASRSLKVIGIEPNADMLRQAEAIALPQDLPNPEYRAGRAEATGLPDGVADVVLSAQAFHWFEPQGALAEFHRLLKPQGWVALVWNERDETDPFTTAVGDVIRTWPGTAKTEGPRGRAGEALLQSPLFVNVERTNFGHGQELDQDGLIGRVFSASYAPKEKELIDQSAARLRQVFGQFHQAGRVVLRYQTSVYTGQRRYPAAS